MRPLNCSPTHRSNPVLALFVVVTLGLSGCAPGEPVPGDGPSIADDPITVLREIRSIPFTLDDELQIGLITELVPMPSGYAVADASGFVHLLNEDLSISARFGGEGAGPTELRGPMDLEVLGTEVAIYDSGNGRIVVINDAGEFQRTIPPGINPAGRFAWLTNGSIISRRGGGRSGLTYYHPSAKGAYGVETRPTQEDLASDEQMPDLTEGHLTAGPTGRVHYYDTATDLFHTFGPEGALQSTLGLPNGVREDVLDARREIQEAFKGGVMGFSFVQGLTTWGEYPVIVAPGLPGLDALALVVDPDLAVLTPVVQGTSVNGSTVPSPTALALKGNVLTIGTKSGLYQYEVSYPAHLRPS